MNRLRQQQVLIWHIRKLNLALSLVLQCMLHHAALLPPQVFSLIAAMSAVLTPVPLPQPAPAPQLCIMQAIRMQLLVATAPLLVLRQATTACAVQTSKMRHQLLGAQMQTLRSWCKTALLHPS